MLNVALIYGERSRISLNSVSQTTVLPCQCYSEVNRLNTLYFEVMSTMNRNRQESMTQASQMHRANMQKNLQRRLEAARAKGDETLIRQLEAEANYIG